MRALALVAMVAGCEPRLTGVELGAVPDSCARFADGIDQGRLVSDVAALAAAPRASEARREETRAYILRALAEAGTPGEEAPFTISGLDGANVIAGSGVVLVGAHFDSVADAPGADDNASGVAVTLAVARALGPRVRYAFFDLEEPRRAMVGSDGRNYAFGSQAYVDSLENREVRVALIVESVGFTCESCQKLPPGLPAGAAPQDGRGVYLVGNLDGAPAWSAVQAAFKLVLRGPYAAYPFVVAGNGKSLPQSRFSDNAPFWDARIDALMITDTANLRNPNYHKDTDVPASIDGAYLAGVARGTVVAAGALAGLCR